MMNDMKLPKGYRAAGVNCGVRKYRPDVGVIVSDRDCTVGAVFTQNSFNGAHIKYAKQILPSSSIRALVINSGHANAATGVEGENDNLLIVNRVAEHLQLKPEQVLSASTGVIGHRIPMDLVLPGIDTAVNQMQDTINKFALSIMTTDLVPKAASEEVELQGGTVNIVGVAKGSGMIHPNMATMFGFIFTDVSINQDSLQHELVRVSDDSFNMISVDGETSPCDTVFLFANGASGVRPNSPEEFDKLHQGFLRVAQKLAIAIARDGEGATKLITVHVKNAYSMEEARNAAREVTVSPLIKSAIHGEDPNWGRILSRLGQSGIRSESFGQLSVDLQGVRVFAKGKPEKINRDDVREKLKSDNILIEIDLANGTHSATAWGCDLTKRYVEINTAYS